jgi:hypothetical protein
MVSILELAHQAASYGHTFCRDPWTGKAYLDSWEGVPSEVRSALEGRWGDLEAILREQSPPTAVAVRCAGNLIGVDGDDNIVNMPRRKSRKCSI